MSPGNAPSRGNGTSAHRDAGNATFLELDATTAANNVYTSAAGGVAARNAAAHAVAARNAAAHAAVVEVEVKDTKSAHSAAERVAGSLPVRGSQDHYFPFLPADATAAFNAAVAKIKADATHPPTAVASVADAHLPVADAAQLSAAASATDATAGDLVTQKALHTVPHILPHISHISRTYLILISPISQQYLDHISPTYTDGI